MTCSQRSYLLYILALGFCIKIDTVQRLPGANGFNYRIAPDDQRTFFGPVLMSETFHAANVRVLVRWPLFIARCSLIDFYFRFAFRVE